MCIHMYTGAYTYKYTHIYTYIHTCICTHVRVEEQMKHHEETFTRVQVSAPKNAFQIDTFFLARERFKTVRDCNKARM